VGHVIYDAHLGDLAIDYIDESEAGAMAKVA
jgi:pyridoxal biosynthesis lyase PdxS